MGNKVFYSIIAIIIIGVLALITWINYVYNYETIRIDTPINGTVGH